MLYVSFPGPSCLLLLLCCVLRQGGGVQGLCRRSAGCMMRDSVVRRRKHPGKYHRNMLLTLYYLTATWIQSWRLNSMRTKILNVLSHNGSLVLYKELESPLTDSEGTFTVQLTGVSSSSCLNSSEARVGDLLWYVGSKRSCSVFPQQKVNANCWINFHNEQSLFPLEISGSSLVSLIDDLKLHLLIEANYLKADGVRSSTYCRLEQYGIPRAWKAGDQFALILESDVDHLAKLGSIFMSNTLSIDDGMEIVRVQTVSVEGRPCLLLNTDSIPITRAPVRIEDGTVSTGAEAAPRCVGQQMSPMQWQTHIELLQSFSAAAAEAVNSESQVGVPAYPSALVTAGNRALTLDYPTVVTLPESADCFPVVNLSRMAREEVQSRSSLNLASQAGGSCSGPASEVAPLPSPARSHQPGLPEAQRSSESFTSCVQEIEIPSPDQEVGPSPERKDASPGNSQEEPPPFSPSRESKSSDSFCSLGSASTVSIGDKTKASEASLVNGQSRIAAHLPLPFTHSQPLGIASGTKVKPPNILVFSESSATVEDVKSMLHSTLHRHKYTIYPVTREQLLSAPWMDNTLLVVVCGNVPESLAPLFLTYVLAGGRMLCLCSDLLHLVLPTFRTAEVRERELVRFSYSRWRGVHLMHHVFCYQASPARTRFSRQDATVVADDGPPMSNEARLSPPKTPASVEVVDADNKPHTLQVQVLGTEETWHSPSLLLASTGSSGGCIVFSQVHLEVDPSEYSADANLAGTLRGSEQARHEILQDLLSQHLGLECSPTQPEPAYSVAYFLGRHELKLELLSRLSSHFAPGSENTLRLPSLTLHFCGKGVEPSRATSSHLPVLVHSCPANFSTVEYFENLHSEILGRLMIYCEVMSSSMNVLTGITLHHGLAVVPCQQTKGVGRGGNVWLSPEGCAMFSMQLIIPTESHLGRYTPFLQHIVGLAIVSGICSLPGYEILNLRLKWPNDIYHGNLEKIGGLVVNCTTEKSTIVCNIGAGVNLDNKVPTTCINALIEEHNKAVPAAKLSPLSREKYMAQVFSELERLLNMAQSGEFDRVQSLYYSYWLHSNAEVTVIGPDGTSQRVVVEGVDSYGFLQVRSQKGSSFTVHPDGNTFDMLHGLVCPKVL